MKEFRAITSAFLFFAGSLLLLLPKAATTAAVIGTRATPLFSDWIGLLIIFISCSIYLTGVAAVHAASVTNDIPNHPNLARYAKKAVHNQQVARELEHLTNELEKGHIHGGINHIGHLHATNIHYLRGKRGGRLFFHQKGEGYEIVGKSGKNNEDAVINAIKKIYHN